MIVVELIGHIIFNMIFTLGGAFVFEFMKYVNENLGYHILVVG
jgi:hypothetical protein